MEQERISEMLSGIDEDLLLETLEGKEMKGMKTKRNWVPAVACCVLLLGAGVVTGLTDLPENVSRFLGMEDETQIKYLANSAISVDLLVEGEQGDIHIKEVMGDSNAIYVFFDFIAPEGTVLNKNFYEFLGNQPSLGGRYASYRLEQLEDQDKTDNKISFAYLIQSEQSLKGEEISLEFTDLYGYEEEEHSSYNSDFVEYIEGTMDKTLNEGYIAEHSPEIRDSLELYQETWETPSFQVEYTDCSNKYKVKHSISTEGLEVILYSISISPFALSYEGEVSRKSENFDLYLSGELMLWDMFEMTVHYADGTSEALGFGGSTAMGKYDNEFFLHCDFLPLLTQEIVAITYLGERIELK